MPDSNPVVEETTSQNGLRHLGITTGNRRRLAAGGELPGLLAGLRRLVEFIGASAWNAWPRKACPTTAHNSACECE